MWPDEYVSFPYAGWWKEGEEKGRWIVAPSGREKQELSRFSKCPS
jgi:hypothetical protein